MGDKITYKAKTFDLSGLNGISDQTLEVHFKLYEGYVKATNDLTARIAELMEGGGIPAEKMAQYSELTRRLGFEYNGMVLHEYYFGNMKRQGGEAPSRSAFRSAVEKSFGSWDRWKADFTSIGRMRGIGWAICYQNPENGALSNHFVEEHHIGNVAGFTPVLVMDLWEHAFMLDYKPADKGKYVEAFMSNIDWTAVEDRLSERLVGTASSR